MQNDLAVQTEALRADAAELTDAAYRLGHGLAGTPGLRVSAPEWAAAGALAILESAVHARLGTVGADTARTARLVRAAADEYDGADDRAARRLAGIG